MLTNKELGYVNVSTGDAPFPGESYASQALDALVKAYQSYIKDYQNKEYDIIMSDGDSLTLEILSSNIAHMLGIDYKHILSAIQSGDTSLPELSKEQCSSYAVLNYIIDHIDEVIQNDRSHKTRLLNYFKIMIKSTIFMSFSNFTAFDFGIIKFNKDDYDETKYKRFSAKSHILLFSQSNELLVPHYIMGLKNDCHGQYSSLIVETMYAHANVAEVIDNQTLVLPTQILITDRANQELTKQTATPQEKIHLLRMYQSIISKARVNANIDIYGDYESLLIDDASKQKTI